MKFPISSPLRKTAVCSLLAAMAATGAHAASGTWTQISAGSASGTWVDSGTSSWAGGIVADGSGFTADFSTLDITANSTVTLGAPRTIGNLIFADTGTSTAGSWTIAGTGANVLTLAGTTPTVTVNGMNNNSLVTISATVEGTSGLTKSGSGLLALSGTNTYTGGTTISAGSLRALSNTAFGTGSVMVANGARLQLNTVTLSNAITLNGSNALLGNTGTSTLSGLVTLGSASTVNLTASNNVAVVLSGTVNLAGNALTFNPGGDTGMQATISGNIVGSGGIIKTGVGILTISGNNSSTFTGSTAVQLGALAVGSDTALGTGVLAFTPGNNNLAGIRSADNNARTISNVVTFGSGINSRYQFGTTTTGNLRFSNTTAISLSSGQKLFEVSNRTQFDAGFTGSGGITMQATTGTLALNGASNYTGATTVNAGTLLVNGSLGNTAVSVTGTGALTSALAGSGTIGGATTIGANAFLTPGEVGTASVLTFGSSLNIAGISTPGALKFDLGTTSDMISLTSGALTIGSALLEFDDFDFNAVAGFGAGTYTLISTTQAISGSLGSNLSGTVSGMNATLSISGNNVILTVVPEPTTAVLLGTGLMTVLVMRRRQRQG